VQATATLVVVSANGAKPLNGYARAAQLTPREATIVDLLPTHLNYGQIGAELYVSVNTVKSNVKSIYRKLGVSSRFEAVAVARELGLIDGQAASSVIESEPLDSTS
jgi:LuxR family maltose regulon positive regulatory protein